MDKVNIHPWPRGHKVKFKVTDVIAVFQGQTLKKTFVCLNDLRSSPYSHGRWVWTRSTYKYYLEVTRSSSRSQRSLPIFARNRHLTALKTSDHHHIHMVGEYGRGQHTPMTSRSQGQVQGHRGHCRFIAKKSISSYSFNRKAMKTHPNVLCSHTQSL